MNDKEQTIIEMYRQNHSIKDIAEAISLTRQRVSQILIKHGLKKNTLAYTPKITDEIRTTILSLHQDGLNVTDIAYSVGITTTGIRSFLKRNNLSPNIYKVNTSRPCVVCSKMFEPKYSDGPKKEKYKTCSQECLSIRLSQAKTKYTEKQIQQVIELKKRSVPNNVIQEILDVDLNKIKEITTEQQLFLTPKQTQRNAYETKIKKNPKAMEEMREAHMEFTQKEFERRISLVEQDVLNGKGTVSGLSIRHGLVPASVVEFLKRTDKSYLLSVHDSTAQKELLEYLTVLLPSDNILYNDRQLISPLELDIFIPSMNLAIEYCGLYWHSEKYRQKDYHTIKMRRCLEHNIQLITIFEDEWMEQRDQVKSFIRSKVGGNKRSIYARKCTLEELNKGKATEFLGMYHIQGASKIDVAFGLYLQDELLAVISGSEHHRIPGQFTLNRLCFKTDVSVVGGASKLNKALCEWANIKGYGKIVTWSDNRWSLGRVYEAMGYKLDEELPPDYSYVYGQKRLSKQSCQKKNLTKRGATGDTEKIMATSLGYARIWDCGKKRWIFTL